MSYLCFVPTFYFEEMITKYRDNSRLDRERCDPRKLYISITTLYIEAK